LRIAHRCVWDLAAKHGWLCQIPFVTPLHSIRDALHEWYSRCRATTPKIAILLWSIWKSRNALVFQNALPNPMCVLIRAKRNRAEWKQPHRNPLLSTLSSSFHLPSPIGPTRSIGWALPPDGVIKLNFGGSLSLAGAASRLGSFLLKHSFKLGPDLCLRHPY